MKISISFISILFFFASFDIFSQQFQLTDEPGNYFTVDRFADEVYFVPWFSNTVKKINLATKEVSETNFPNLPVFMHHSHKAVYHETTSSSVTYFLYDYSNDSVKQILHRNFNSELLKINDFGEPYYSISPEDTKLLLYSAFVIADSTWLPVSFEIYGEEWPQVWSSDSTFIFKPLNNALAEYNFTTQIIDTLVKKDSSNLITGFDYNLQHNLLAYSIGEGFSDVKLFIYNKDTQIDRTVFDPNVQYYFCQDQWFQFDELRWSPNWNYLVYFGYNYTNPATGIHLYDVLADSVIDVTRCDHYGSKQNVEWINNDSILYTRIELDRIYGYNLTSILTSVDDVESEIYNLFISNYPNPFNPNTTIEFRIPNTEQETVNVELKVFDVLGREVATLVNKQKKAGSYEVEFDASNLGSGIYFYRIKAGKFVESRKMILLK